jgi:hypothetical protein
LTLPGNARGAGAPLLFIVSAVAFCVGDCVSGDAGLPIVVFLVVWGSFRALNGYLLFRKNADE